MATKFSEKRKLAAHDLEDSKVVIKREKDCAHDHPFLRIRKNGVTAASRDRITKPMRFVSLHHHSTFSYLDGYQLPAAHIRRAQEINMGAIAFTEHGNVSGHVKAEKAAVDTGIQVIYGCELYMAISREPTQLKNHLTVLAATEEGYNNLLRLVSKTFAEGFYYEPTATWRMLNEHKRGLIILSGCTGSLLFCSAVGGKQIEAADASYGRALEVARKFKRAFGDAYYIEVQAFPELEQTCKANPILARVSRTLGIPLVATMDCHYTDLEEAEAQKILHNVRGGTKKTMEELAREWGYEVPLCPPPNDKTIYRRLRETGLSKSEAVEAVVSSEEIAQRVEMRTLPRLPLPRFPTGGEAVEDVWREWIREGWRYRGCDSLPPAERRRYRRQLAHEMEVIEAKDFIDYFLIVSDAVKFTKDSGIPVGPARGSAAASIVCWLLRITEVNPMDFPMLVFERFIDITRDDLPDIDLDFPGESRPIIRKYLVDKYGEGCVNNIGTFSYYKSRLALDDVARVYRIPKFEVETVKELLIERSSGDLRASATIEDTVDQFERARDVFVKYPELGYSMDLEGNVKGFGVHAAGLVVSNGPITEVCAVYEREVPKGSGNVVQVISLDKYDAERQGLVKLDFLGLSTMSQIWAMCDAVGMKQDDLYGLPLDDQRVIEAFHRADVVGIFQFDGQATQSICAAIRPDNFQEIADTNALSRPGPLHNGAASAYTEIKHGLRNPEKVHPAVDNILAETKYQIVYQEQILRIVREVGDFPWTHAAHIRRIISRKIGEQEFNRQWGRFWEGASTVHKRQDVPPMTEEMARSIWGNMITSGSYAFNVAHSVSYGLLAYWTMWFKVYHPAVFYAAALDKLPDTKQHSLLRDADRHRVAVRPPHPTKSKSSWRPAGKRAVRAGLSQIDGVGEKTAADMLSYRRQRPGTVKDWWDYISVKGIGAKTIEKIMEFAEAEDPFGTFTIDRNVKKVMAELPTLRGSDGRKLPMPTVRAGDVEHAQVRGEISKDCVWLGTILNRNIRDLFETNRAKTGEELKPEEVRDPHLNEWFIGQGEDETGRLGLRIDRWRYPKLKSQLFSVALGQDLVLVEGRLAVSAWARQIHIRRMVVIDPE